MQTTATHALERNYRFWAQLPDVAAVLLLPDVPEYPIHPMAVRPSFPKGVCQSCGCTDDDACLVEDDGSGPVGCHWINPEQTRCSACGPARRS